MNRFIGGFVAQHAGAAFEARIERQCRIELLTFVKIPPGCKSLGVHKLIRVKSPFDCIIGFEKQLVLIDLKSTRGNKISMADSIIKPHQKRALMGISRHQKAGILVNFQNLNQIVFFEASQLYGKPLGPEDGKIIVSLKELF